VILDLPIRDPKPREIVVRVLAAGVNLVDTLFRDGYLATGPFPLVLGSDFAGVVTVVGSEVTEFATGDEVYGYKLLGNGTYAEYVTVDADLAARKPANLSFAEAAAVPCAGLVAYDALANTLALQPAETVVIGAASGGVGHFAVQIAKALGAVVAATAHPDRARFVEDLGADLVVDQYGDVAGAVRAAYPGGVDTGFPTVAPIENAVRDAVRDGGRITWINGRTGPSLERGITGAETNGSRGTRMLDQLTALFESGAVHTVHLERRYPLAEARQAQLDVSSGHVRGKLVIDVDEA